MTGAASRIDDDDLEKLTVEPPRRLFPILGAAEAMIPLVAVLAFLPALYAAVHGTLTEQRALQGLAGLRVLSAVDASGAVFPSNFEPLEQLRFQPPLMSWLNAAGMKTLGIDRMTGLAAAPYLCTAGLLLAAYVLARRLGGELLGLVTVLLLAFNPLILEGARQPIPQSAAVMFALLTLAGVITHWQKSSSLASYQLLLGGISLGLCLLAGGPLALAVAVILVIYIVIWKIEAHGRKHCGIVRDRSHFARRTAIRSWIVLVTTGFALAGWQVLLSSSGDGTEFWSRWFIPAGRDPLSASSGWALSLVTSAWPEFNRLALPVGGFALLGLGTVIRDVWRGPEDPARRHRLILFPWIGVALVGWATEGGSLFPDDAYARLWATILAIPLIMAAAIGAIEIAERRVAFAAAIIISLISLADTVYYGRASIDAAGRSAALPAGNPGDLAIIAALGMMICLALFRFAGESEIRRRSVLSVLLGAIVVTNCSWGIAALHPAASADREVEDLRAGLSRLVRVDQCTFVAPMRRNQATAAGQPPVSLVYGLATLWPTARFQFANSWEAAVAQQGSELSSDDAAQILYVAWSPRGIARISAPDPSLKPVAPSVLFRGLEVVAYTRDAGRQFLPDSAAETRVSLDAR